jgi:hypothetical protein
VLGRGLTLYGDLVPRLLHLLLADLEQDLGGAQGVVDPGLAVDEDVVCLDLAGQVRGALRLEQRGEGQQLGVAVLVDRVDGVGDLVLLRGELDPPVREVGLGGFEALHRGVELALHLLVAGPGRVEPRADLDQVVTGPGQLGRGGLEPRGGAAHLAAGVLEVIVCGLDLVVDGFPLVLEILGVGQRDRQRAGRHGTGRDRGCPASASGTGEEAHRFCLRHLGEGTP